MNRSIWKDVGFFETTGKTLSSLEKLHQTLLPIKPSSVVAEKAFSITGKCFMKFEARMEVNAINELVLSRHHFKE